MRPVLTLAAKKSRTNMKLYMSDFDKLSVDSLQNASENVHLESKQEQEVDVEQKDDASASALSRLETTFARGPLTKDELFACENVLSKSMCLTKDYGVAQSRCVLGFTMHMFVLTKKMLSSTRCLSLYQVA
jgi:hypothetical protein